MEVQEKMSRFLRFFRIFAIAFLCAFGVHISVSAETITVTYNCGTGGGLTTTPTMSSCNCDEAMNGSTDGNIYTTSDCQCVNLAASSFCQAPSGKQLAGWRAGKTLWMFKPNDKFAVSGDAFRNFGTMKSDFSGTKDVLFNAVWVD